MARQYTLREATPRMRIAAAKRDLLAEHVVNEGTFTDFARDNAMTYRGVQLMWRAIRDGLGSQAQ